LLAVFRMDAEACLAHIAEEPDGTSLSAFTTQVHAMKSALANIGADGPSRKAALLEKAGKEADMPLIRETLPAFREELAALTANIGAALTPDVPDSPNAPETTNAPNVPNAPETTDDEEDLDPAVAELLKRLRDALEAVDIDATDTVLARLQALPLPAALRDAVNETAEYILTADFHKALETVAGRLGRRRS
jgi:HPt (histidine-containing phosphotransfer) domain-containing protein